MVGGIMQAISKPRLTIKAKGIPTLKNKGFYLIYDMEDNIIADHNKLEKAVELAKNKGYDDTEISIGFNNKDNAICIW